MNVWSTQATLIEIVNILQHSFANQKELKKHCLLNFWAYGDATENVSSYKCLNVWGFFFLNKLFLLAILRKDKKPQVREATSPASLVKSNTDQFSFFQSPHLQTELTGDNNPCMYLTGKLAADMQAHSLD